MEANEPDREKNFHYRAAFQKMGSARFLSHLEMTKHLRFAFQEVDIPLSLSCGTRPQPRISFGPALPMNVESKEEFVDFFTYRYISPHDFVKRANEVLASGIQFLQVVPISKNAPSLSSLIDGADYSVDFTHPASEALLQEYAIGTGASEADCHRIAIGRFIEKREILFTKHKNEKVINIKDYVRSLHYEGPQARLFVEMKIVDGSTVGIQQVLKALYQNEVELPVLRERLYIWGNGLKRSPLTLEWEQMQMQKHLMNLSL